MAGRGTIISCAHLPSGKIYLIQTVLGSGGIRNSTTVIGDINSSQVPVGDFSLLVDDAV
jgi:hypothetical protein